MKKIWLIIIISIGAGLAAMVIYAFVNALEDQFIHVAYSVDGQNFSWKKTVYRGLAQGETGVKLKDGRIALYGLDHIKISSHDVIDTQTDHHLSDLAIVVSTDGLNFQRQKLTITNLNQDIRVADSTIIELPSGGYRLYFVRYSDLEMFSAGSVDGFNFTFEGSLKDVSNNGKLYAADPIFLYEKNAQKYYLYSRDEQNPGSVSVRESIDGRAFGSVKSISSPFNIGFAILDGGDHYVAYGTPFFKAGQMTDLRYPVLAESKDGLNWQVSGQIIGPWTGNQLAMGCNLAIKNSQGYYCYW